MKKSQVEHVIRAASKICEEDEFIIIGSQSLHGKYPDIADDILMSQEVDLYLKKYIAKTELLNVIGMDSPFHETFGYYADPCDAQTAVLPKNWKNRLVHLKMAQQDSAVRAYCLDPHDLVVAKLAAARDKDKVFIRALLARGMVKAEIVQQRLQETAVSPARLVAMESLLTQLINHNN